MFTTILQIWAGGCSLLNKVCFSFAERRDDQTKQVWLIRAWSILLMASPAWTALFILKQRWIVVSLQFAAVVITVTGIVIAHRGTNKQPKWLNPVTLIIITIGISYSAYDLRGVGSFPQVLEFIITACFLIGGYLLANQRISGYFWFLLMSIFGAALMYVEDYPWLMWQQIISFGLVSDALIARKLRENIDVT